MKKYKVIIPYVDQITFDTSTIRSRRDHERFLALIEVTTFLYQYQREKEVRNGVEYLIASIKDYAIAHELAQKILFNTTSGISPGLELFMDKVWKLAEEKSGNGVSIKGVKFTNKDIRDKIKGSKSTINNYLKIAEEKDLIEVLRQGPGKPNIYSVSKKVSEVKEDYLISTENLIKEFSRVKNQTQPAQPDNCSDNSINYNLLNQRDQAATAGI
ncbi:MAG: hypothetical protein GF353_01335 [Candidatus Lokiarchaeota archaeon]|nr:hypothetical protein [Candidatus Lokiarchaeota archaeon]